MLYIKAYDRVVEQQDAINEFMQSVDVLENGLKFNSLGQLIVLYIPKPTPEELAAKKEKEDKDIKKLPEVAADFNHESLLKMLSSEQNKLVEAALELYVCQDVQKDKAADTDTNNKRAVNVAMAQRKVDTAQVTVNAIKKALAELEAGTLVL